MKPKDAIRILKTKKSQPSTDYQLAEALSMAISALEKQEQSCDTCKHRNERFSGKRCGDCSVGYPDRYEAETNFEELRTLHGGR